MNWQDVLGNWILVPPQPVGIIHFLGGAFVAAAPHLTYRWLLENLARQGYIIVATPFVNRFEHDAIATEVLETFEQGLYYLERQVLRQAYLPIYGLGHSMGCKLHLLINSQYRVERAGNMLISFNNYPAKRSIPLLEQFISFAPAFDVEFTPSPAETLALVRDRYPVRRNLLVKFRKDDIDQTRALSEVLVPIYPDLTAIEWLRGTHTTPIAQEIGWQPGQSFSPLDALGQFVKQEFYRDLNTLLETLLFWLDPAAIRRRPVS